MWRAGSGLMLAALSGPWSHSWRFWLLRHFCSARPGPHGQPMTPRHRICLMLAAVLALGSAASAAERDRPTAILVSPVHEAQIVRADDGKDHVEYELLVVNVFSEPVTLASVAVLDPAGKALMRIEGGALAAATQTLFAKTATPVVAASAAVSVDV